jgi:hypothetical protein
MSTQIDEILKRFKELEAMVNALQKPLPTPVHESPIVHPTPMPQIPGVWTNHDLDNHVRKLVGFQFADFGRLAVPTPQYEVAQWERWDVMIEPDVSIIKGDDSYTLDWKMSSTRRGYVARLRYHYGILTIHGMPYHGWTVNLYQDYFFLSQDEAHDFAKKATRPIGLVNFVINHRTRASIYEMGAMAEMVRMRNEMKGK